jgi:hypothetical protein
MSNKEVAGLQALAQRHGGQLSVNPTTGLPEAGFLDNLLPMVAGGALTAFTGIDPMTSAAIVGGITALDSKDLSKGLVAGLGAYGGGSLYEGLAGAGLGAIGPELSANAAANAAGQGLTGEAYNQAVQEQVASQLAEKNLASEGASQLFSKPGQTLATMGGGSMLRGGLPILAGLAPAAVEAFDEEDEDKPPEQHKGYIRKYALDPVTGQYKQVGVYEAGGDPNVDVSAKAGTAGAYGGVRQSEYEAAQGMADGGSTSDSSRIYDYLMGRGPNPMQFTHTTAPAPTVVPTPAPITPTTPILEPVYDPYGNVQHSGNYDAEKHAADLEARNDYLSVDGKDMTLNKYFDLNAVDREALDKRAAEVSPIRHFVGEVAKFALPGGIASKFISNFKMPTFGTPVDLNQTIPLSYDPNGYVRYNASGNPMTPDEAAKAQLGEQIAETNDKAYATYSPPQGDPAQQAAVQDAINKTDFSGMDRGGGRASSGDNNGGGINPGGYSNSLTRSSDNVGGSMAAHGGYLQHGQFDQRMARGGLPAPHAFYHQGKFGYKGPQVYADGGGIADLEGHYNLGGYSDGGRLLKGPGNGTSDDIPATIGHNQPARLADGEFVIPARIVSEIGNGSTDAGARELYKMMDRIQQGRAKTVGKDKVAFDAKARNHLPA